MASLGLHLCFLLYVFVCQISAKILSAHRQCSLLTEIDCHKKVLMAGFENRLYYLMEISSDLVHYLRNY